VDARIEKFKTLHGWEDGRCKNLSGFEGDFSEPDATIKIMPCLQVPQSGIDSTEYQ
jgi:hypothetical protein